MRSDHTCSSGKSQKKRKPTATAVAKEISLDANWFLSKLAADSSGAELI